ncbi:hypothetical protein GCM10020295_74080 [Streptomyces cinereospinus]
MPSPQQARAQASAITSGKTVPEAEAAPTSQLRALFDQPRLSPGQRRIAQYLIEHITEAAFLSITDLADRVGVSQPSVTRFAGAVGFTGYPALRERLQAIALGALAGGPRPRRRTAATSCSRRWTPRSITWRTCAGTSPIPTGSSRPAGSCRRPPR